MKGKKMKTVGISLIIISIVTYVVLLGWGLVYYEYWYSFNIGQFVKLSDDASTADVKLQYLQKYAVQIEKHITRNQARYIFKQERFTRDKQLQIIDTLIDRLKQTKEMNPKSFEYQQAMAQISGQEYDHTLSEIDGVIQGCWLRQASLGVFGLWFAWLPCLLILIVGVYTSGQRAPYAVLTKGDEVMALILAGQDIAIGDYLISSGDGTLKKLSAASSGVTVKQLIAEAREACDLTGSGAVNTLARVRLKLYDPDIC